MKKHISKVASVLSLGLMMATASFSAEQKNIQEVFTQNNYDIELSQDELGLAQIAHDEGISLDSIFATIVDARVSTKQQEEIDTQVLISSKVGVVDDLVAFTKDLSEALAESILEDELAQETENALNESVKDLVARIEEEKKQKQEAEDYQFAMDLCIAMRQANNS